MPQRETQADRLGVRLGDVARQSNRFDVLRLVAAVAVLVSHSFALTGREDPVGRLSGETLGELGVSVFFAISGFLIVRSWQSQPSLRVFAMKRALRLLPALAVVCFFVAFVVGPVFTSRSLTDYLLDPTPYMYFVRASLLLTFAGTLPGVFEDNPVPHAVNGSLWTLPVEATAYLLVAALGVAGLLTRPRLATALFAALVVLSLPQVHLDTLPATADGTAGGSLPLVVRLLAMFMAGGLLWIHRDRIPLRWWLAGLLVALWVVSWKTPALLTVAIFTVPYVVVVVAYRSWPRLIALVAAGDLSYGIYVYAFPVQQATADVAGPALAPGAMLAIALPVTYALAFVSWRLVERPALAYKRRLTERRDEPVPAGGSARSEPRARVLGRGRHAKPVDDVSTRAAPWDEGDEGRRRGND